MDARYSATFSTPQLENRKAYRCHNSFGSIERIVVPTPRKLGIIQCSPAAPTRTDPLYGEVVEELQTILHNACDSSADSSLTHVEDICSRPLSPPLRSSNPIVCNSAFERAGENDSCTRLCLPSWKPPAAARVRATWTVSSV
mmetsp:Transcript_17706/g.24627  ORF Transcript_17706/g.24627 Transcript_17706/m.24627 type:complete len:142 (+) Transcript_17706:386-811(+)